MMNYIWSGLILLSLLISLFTGKLEATTAAAMDGAAEAVTTCISLLGIMCLWTGMAKIAEKSGLVNLLAKLMRPLTRFLFPKLEKDSPALHAIVLNMVANLLGMGNAATPLGLKAMKELDKRNHSSSTASNEMCMFVVINTASLQLIPTTLIGLRQAFGAANPGIVIVPIWIVSICALTAGVLTAKWLQRRL